MIVLPTKRRLERRRDALYKQLHLYWQRISVHDMEEILRKIHGINFKLKSYFIREGEHEAAELFEENDDLEVKFPFETEDPITFSIEEKQGEIEVRNIGD
jgi:hypothetical protein